MENELQNEPVKTSLWRKLGLALVLFVVLLGFVYTLGGFVLLPRLAKDLLENYVQENVGRQLRLHDIEFNPFSFSTRLNGVELREADGTLLFSLQSLSVNIQPQDLIDGKVTLSEVSLQAPWVHLQIDKEGNLNLAKLIEDAGAEKKEEDSMAAKESPLHFLVKHFQIRNGVFKVTDLSGTSPAIAHLVPINLELNDLSNQPETKAPVNLTATTSGGGSLHWEGDLSLQPFASRGQMQLRGIRLLTAWEFLQDELNIDPPQGLIDLEAQYSFSHSDSGPSLIVDGLRIQLSDLLLRLDGAANPLLKMQVIELSDGRFELDGNQLTIGQLLIADGLLSVTREKRLVDWEKLIRPTEDNAQRNDKPADGGLDPDWRAELMRLSVENVALEFDDRDLNRPLASSIGNAGLSLSAKAQQKGSQLSAGIEGVELKLREIALKQTGVPSPLLLLKEAAVHQGSMDLASHSLVLGKVELTGGQTRVVREKSGRLDWEKVWDQKTSPRKSSPTVESSGTPWRIEVASILLDNFDIALSDHTNELPAELHLSPIDLKLSKVSSALDKPIGIDLSVTVKEGGNLAVKGELDAAKPGAELYVDVSGLSLLPLRPYLQPVANIELGSGMFSTGGRFSYGKSQKDALSYNGAVRIDNLLIREPETGETLLGWKAFNAAEMALSLKPDSLHVKEVLLSKPVGKFVVNKDLSSNWQKIAKSQSGSDMKDAPEAATPVFPVSVERIQIDGGALDFADFSLPLAFSTKVHELSGAIVGISSEPGAKASSDLKGRVNEFGSATIKGKIAPFDPLLFTDMGVVFSNLDVANLTPYTAKFAGYQIDSGKLSLDLKYKIDGRKLQGENQIVLNKLTLGKKVESPDAIDAPLELAIALMQDNRGIIDLGLPIRGDLDDPEFSYGHLVFKAIGNLITKIVTAPFRVLGALFGVAGEDLDLVAFEPGSAVVPPSEQEKLKAVAKVLLERPKLVLEIQGHYDQKVDGDALKELAVRMDIGKRLGRKSTPEKEPDPISLTDVKTRSAVEALFTERFSAEELARLKTPAKPQQGAASTKRDVIEKDVQSDVAQEKAPLPAADLYEKLYQSLIETQPLQTAALNKLAQGRGQAIAREVQKRGKLSDARIKLLKPISVNSPDADKVISKLNLGVGK